MLFRLLSGQSAGPGPGELASIPALHPSLCSLVLLMPVCPPVNLGAGPGDPLPLETWESSGIPESAPGLFGGNRNRLAGLGGAAVQAGGLSSWSPN